MKGKKKTPKVPGFMRTILAGNVSRLMDHQYRDSSNRPMALAKDAGVSLSTIQRVLSKESGATLDNIEAIAAAFDVSVYQLLIPSLDILNPQVVQGAMKNEERMYRQWKRGEERARPVVPPRERV